MTSKTKYNNHVAKAEKSGNKGSVSVAAWEGPIPPPQVLAEYDNTKQGLSEIIIKQWVDESEHRRTLEKETVRQRGEELAIHRIAIDAEAFKQKWITIVSLTIAVAFSIGGLILIYFGKQVEGLSSLAFVIAAIIFGKLQDSKQEKES